MKYSLTPGDGTDGPTTEDDIRDLERGRLQALVAADIERAALMHADDFQLVNPAGRTYSKAEYLGDIQSGAIDYRIWQPGNIAVRLHDDVAVIRYEAEMEIALAGRLLPRQHLYHTDVYERIAGRWQVTWSQATRIQNA